MLFTILILCGYNDNDYVFFNIYILFINNQTLPGESFLEPMTSESNANEGIADRSNNSFQLVHYQADSF